jgi:hypothetical protein
MGRIAVSHLEAIREKNRDEVGAIVGTRGFTFGSLATFSLSFFLLLPSYWKITARYSSVVWSLERLSRGIKGGTCLVVRWIDSSLTAATTVQSFIPVKQII